MYISNLPKLMMRLVHHTDSFGGKNAGVAKLDASIEASNEPPLLYLYNIMPYFVVSPPNICLYPHRSA